MSKITKKQEQSELDQEKMKVKVDKAAEEFDLFLAELIDKHGLTIQPVIKSNPYSIYATFDFFLASDEQKKVAKERLGKKSPIVIAKSGVGLGS